MTANGRSVVVLGMHRSGTSAVTRVVNLLGPSLCRDDDLYVAADNPTGHWESNTLVGFNDRLLELRGGEVRFPPPSDPGWQETAVVRSLKEEARRSFYAVHPSTPWVWKDPRTCLTWPFWRSVLDEDPIPLLVVRNPLEVARSLRRRGDAIRTAHSLALWERYTHDALAAVADGPVVMLDYAAVVAEPNLAVAALASHLRDAGAGIRDGRLADAASFVVGEATSQPVATALESRDLNGAQRELIRYVDRLAGEAGGTVMRDEIPPLSAAGTELLDALRHEWQAKSHRMSVTEAVISSRLAIAVRKRAAMRARLRSRIAEHSRD